MVQQGRVLKLGDHINTDDIIPTKRGTNGDPDYLKWSGLSAGSTT